MPFIIFLFLVLATSAFAQQKAPMTPMDQALSEKILDELNNSLQLRVQLIAAQARIKELEQLLEEKKQSSSQDKPIIPRPPEIK